jgi:hypothetical protein
MQVSLDFFVILSNCFDFIIKTRVIDYSREYSTALQFGHCVCTYIYEQFS